jgi:hypothetical protein
MRCAAPLILVAVVSPLLVSCGPSDGATTSDPAGRAEPSAREVRSA